MEEAASLDLLKVERFRPPFYDLAGPKGPDAMLGVGEFAYLTDHAMRDLVTQKRYLR